MFLSLFLLALFPRIQGNGYLTCNGHWVDDFNPLDDNFVTSNRWQRQTPPSSPSSNASLFVCPAESDTYNCFVNKTDTARAKAVQKRNFVLSNVSSTWCRYYSSYDFLKALENKSVLFLGDSVTLQMYQNIVCELQISARAVFQVDLAKKGMGQGHVYFPASNTKLSFFTLNWGLYQRHLPYFLKRNHHLFVIQFGIHYNSYVGKPPGDYDEFDYRQHLRELQEDIILHNATNDVSVYLVQSPPQHFVGSGNGYWTNERSRNHFDQCGPLRNLSRAYAEDWRNRGIDEIDWPSRVKVVRISDDLYTQWDAHFSDSDCTHYCKFSGVWDFVRLMLYNSIISNS